MCTRSSASIILNLIKEEELQSDALKQSATTIVAAADSIDANGVALEQAFNREQVQGFIVAFVDSSLVSCLY
jgi:hypothetical protein